jgi:hypothetical protein
MFPYHLIRRTPEQEQELRRRLELMHRRHANPVDVQQTANGFVASRNGFTGEGATEDEAWENLHRKEMQDILYPPT